MSVCVTWALRLIVNRVPKNDHKKDCRQYYFIIFTTWPYSLQFILDIKGMLISQGYGGEILFPVTLYMKSNSATVKWVRREIISSCAICFFIW